MDTKSLVTLRRGVTRLCRGSFLSLIVKKMLFLFFFKSFLLYFDKIFNLSLHIFLALTGK